MCLDLFFNNYSLDRCPPGGPGPALNPCGVVSGPLPLDSGGLCGSGGLSFLSPPSPRFILGRSDGVPGPAFTAHHLPRSVSGEAPPSVTTSAHRVTASSAGDRSVAAAVASCSRTSESNFRGHWRISNQSARRSLSIAVFIGQSGRGGARTGF